MKRTVILTNIIFDMYMEQNSELKHAHEGGGWPPYVFFHDDKYGLTKRSLSVPKCYVNKLGEVDPKKLEKRLWVSIYRDVKNGLGYHCGENR